MRVAPESVNLLGRSAAERKLDRVYNAQKKVIKDGKGLANSTSDANLPFPDIYKKSEAKTPKISSNVKDAIEILGKHLRNEKKFEKSITLLAKIIESHYKDYKMEFMELLEVCLDQVSKLDNLTYCTFSSSPIIIALKTITNAIRPDYIKFSEKIDSKDDYKIKIRRFMLHLGHSISLINETDSFIFSDHVKSLEDVFKNYISVDATEEDKTAFVNSLGTLFKFSSITWAYPMVSSFFNKLYLQKEIFKDSNLSKIESWQADLKISGKKTTRELALNEIGKSAKGVKDGRAEVIVTTHGSQVWSNKQFGF